MTTLGLIITPPRLGDTVFCLPGLQWLQRCKPDITWHILALSPVSAQVFAHHPFFKDIFIATIETHKGWLKSRKHLSLPQGFSFDCYQHVLGIDYNTGRMPQFNPYYGPHWQLITARPEAVHQAAHVLQYIETFCQQQALPDVRQYEIYPAAPDRVWVDQFLLQHQVQQDQALVVLHLGCHGLKKHRSLLRRSSQHRKAWPLTYWLRLAKQLKSRHSHIRFVLTGTLAEAHLAEVFINQFPSTINAIAQTNIQQLAVLLSKANLFISGDTGPLHIACSTSVPLIALFGPTDFKTTGPFPLNAHRHCLWHSDLAAIEPGEVAIMAEPWLVAKDGVSPSS